MLTCQVIMMLAYAQRANDNAYLAQHYDLLRQWTQFLINDSLYPANQLSTDDFAGTLEYVPHDQSLSPSAYKYYRNQTNLAIKGIIGIEAMAQIANRTGHIADGINYTSIAHDYVRQWQTIGFNYNDNPPHATLSYSEEWWLPYATDTMTLTLYH